MFSNLNIKVRSTTLATIRWIKKKSFKFSLFHNTESWKILNYTQLYAVFVISGKIMSGERIEI